MRLLVLALLLVLGGWGALFGWSFFPAATPRQGFVEVVVEAGPRGSVFDELAQRGLLDHPTLMRFAAALLAPGLQVRARSHLLRPGLTPRQILQHLAGNSRTPVRVTFPEGFNRFQMAERLETSGVCARSAFLAWSQKQEILSALGIRASTAEGYLFPSTYELHLDSSAEEVVGRMIREGRDRLTELIEAAGGLPEELETLGLGAHEVIILASIVEKETARPQERGRIARVFLNRLADPFGPTSGRLQSDPTATYGCLVLGERAPSSCVHDRGPPTPAMLRDESNPYGTYRRPGLPPGPIGNPGRDAVQAVLTAPPSRELFFVADGAGNHTFSETFQQHRNAIKKLRSQRP